MTNTTWTSGQRTRISSKGHVAPKFPNACRSVIYHSILQLNRNKLPVDTKFVSLKWSSMVEELTDFPNPPMVGVLKSCNCGWVVGCFYPLSAKPSLQWMIWRKPAFVAVRWWWCAPYVPLCAGKSKLCNSQWCISKLGPWKFIAFLLKWSISNKLEVSPISVDMHLSHILFSATAVRQKAWLQWRSWLKVLLIQRLGVEIRRTVKLVFALRLLDKSREENMGNSALAADSMDETQAQRCVPDFFPALNFGALDRSTLQRALQQRHFGKDLFWAKEMSMLKQPVSSRPQTFLLVDLKKHVISAVYMLVKPFWTWWNPKQIWIFANSQKLNQLTPVESNFC